MIQTTIVIIIIVGLLLYKIIPRISFAKEKTWRARATQIGMNYVPLEKKSIWKKMKEYKTDISNPRVRRRKETIMNGSAKGAKINGNLVHEIERVGTKERMQPVKFELEFVDNTKNFTQLIIKKKRWLGNLFIKTPESMKVKLPPHLEETFEALSVRPGKTGKAVREITPLLNKDMKHLTIHMSNHTISLSMNRSKVTVERLFTMKRIGIKLLEVEENHEI